MGCGFRGVGGDLLGGRGALELRFHLDPLVGPASVRGMEAEGQFMGVLRVGSRGCGFGG